MNQPKYALETSADSDVYQFTSVGVKGAISKVIQYSPTANSRIYNLGFGDRLETPAEDGSVVFALDDATDSKNGDAEKVIATVVASIYDYTRRHPGRQIFFSGSDERRTRGYRLAITRHYEELQADFHIFGIIEKDGGLMRVPFDSRTSVIGYLVYRKLNAA